MEKDQAYHEQPKASENQTQKLTQEEKTSTLKPTTATATATSKQQRIWDCGSALYDSFELSSFQKQLDSAMISSSRTFSMPRLPSQGGPAPPKKNNPPSSKLSRSFRKLLKSVFRSKPVNYDSDPEPSPCFPDQPARSKEVDGGSKYFVVYEKVNALSTIPEVPEPAFSPEIGSLVRRTMSERFRSSSVNFYCG